MLFLFFFKLKTAYEMRISDWSSDVCSSDLRNPRRACRTDRRRCRHHQGQGSAATQAARRHQRGPGSKDRLRRHQPGLFHQLRDPIGRPMSSDLNLSQEELEALRQGIADGIIASNAGVMQAGEVAPYAFGSYEEDRKSTRLNSSH